MNDEEELVACVKLEGGNVIIYPLSRGEAHRFNVPHIVVRVLGFNRDGLLLVQKRSKLKKSNPGKYTDTASGHVSPHEASSLTGLASAARRELLEEMGVDGEISFFTGPIYDEEDNEVNYAFLALINGTPAFGSEVDPEGSGFKTPSELREMLSSQPFVHIAKFLWEMFLEKYPCLDDVKRLASGFRSAVPGKDLRKDLASLLTPRRSG
ncbi:MAG: NUDIX domain-containing protein [Candidatus Freyarchaeota archaeon]|nr:NUDIX domain-containing protein [Candidatus Freyrarchaeum guaymaensis]